MRWVVKRIIVHVCDCLDAISFRNEKKRTELVILSNAENRETGTAGCRLVEAGGGANPDGESPSSRHWSAWVFVQRREPARTLSRNAALVSDV